MHEAVEGLRFVRSQPILLGAISLDLFAVLFGGAVALLPAIAEDRLGVGAVGLGWLRAATGIGAGAVALYLTVQPVSRRIGRTLLVSVALFGVGTIVLGVTTSFAIAFVALLVLSGADAVSVFIRSTLVPSGHAGRQARACARGRGGVHRRVERARRVRVGGASASCSARRPRSCSAASPRSRWPRSGGGIFPALREVDAFPSAGDHVVRS